jgi:hypothetical protein
VLGPGQALCSRSSRSSGSAFSSTEPSGRPALNWAVAGQENSFSRHDLAYDDRDEKAFK